LAEELGDGHRGTRDSGGEARGSSVNSNIATGNARVGLQAQKIYGGVWLTPDHGNGQTGFVAIERHGNGSARTRMVLAWLRAVLSDIAGLATGVAAVLTVVRSPT
jgi:hypothetical protein